MKIFDWKYAEGIFFNVTPCG